MKRTPYNLNSDTGMSSRHKNIILKIKFEKKQGKTLQYASGSDMNKCA